jgi:hypothetical protein
MPNDLCFVIYLYVVRNEIESKTNVIKNNDFFFLFENRKTTLNVHWFQYFFFIIWLKKIIQFFFCKQEKKSVEIVRLYGPLYLNFK